METKSCYKEELISILVEINRLVTEHLKVQKGVFNPPIKAKIPFISKRNDFGGLYETNQKIQNELYQTIRKMHNNKSELNIDPFIYGGIKEYTLLFHSSSEKLTRIIYELNLKAKKQNKLSAEEYNQLVSEYEIIENSRLEKGSRIQKIATLLAQ
ncbi:hypothetical protein RCG17_07515 [Neobacillus sp. PS3-12]|uniref:hypothetical protein n=1 Tax=Neobacillus sp. PS3-12 TaxID=3070677 RepID=UPI0027E212F5|nr:hypothetical protein [Neobacillus sp. PS3-12]WML54452.1 hypothetical protein RCG17_07515 [Neobacillus sp. PS3-12]